MTSLAPIFAFMSAGMNAHAAPPAAAASRIVGTAANHGIAPTNMPTNAAASPPRKSWPSAPMLKRPARKP